ncbi:hypothetical protein BOX15_Mlig016175g1 [Macrostomum lignano]|uniref:Uncharacterized protein n=1 Tax=Macrostomum lignano TaxID=282301 RepID=A0A267FWD9_9PLAT|nr:hypothetical protein BOX15_Mlig016175g1 [Macrostomum lignano]
MSVRKVLPQLEIFGTCTATASNNVIQAAAPPTKVSTMAQPNTVPQQGLFPNLDVFKNCQLQSQDKLQHVQPSQQFVQPNLWLDQSPPQQQGPPQCAQNDQQPSGPVEPAFVFGENIPLFSSDFFLIEAVPFEQELSTILQMSPAVPTLPVFTDEG